MFPWSRGLSPTSQPVPLHLCDPVVRESLRTWPSIYHLGSWHTITLVQYQSGAVETFPESFLPLSTVSKFLEVGEGAGGFRSWKKTCGEDLCSLQTNV